MTVRNILKKMLRILLSRWKLILVILAVLALGGWWYYGKTQAAKISQTFVRPTQENLVKTLQVSGVVDVTEKARLRFIAGGKITYLGAKEGDQVKKGQTLAIIDRATLQKQLNQDLNNYMKERWDFEQGKDDVPERTLTDAERRDLDKSQWDLENQVLNVEIRDISIQNTVISAPFAGILTVSPTNVTGVQLLATDAFELVNPETLIFVAKVDEADIAQIKTGQLTNIVLDAYLEKNFKTAVDSIAFTNSQSTSGTTFEVKFPLSQVADRGLLRLGMNGDANIVLDERQNVMTIPITATKQRDDKTYVDVKTSDNSTQEREIQVGLENDDTYEVLSGLSLDDEILLPE
ncbi:MAG: hypothetical protein COY81_01820 [Candidatus Pacebacteria bacterium CG_4_10_14_0_8_um_filter_43_12]|nr:MAG: hypothetical protein COU66_01380 [Candidatus Pacebacteria bacterium CG10_big_fil_rev_8_21_14_0_10_44_11]PIY79590.1 MAG: hypothetical protein COY81_01820 [Candidatus Pacebacteria bacterium CG_4_10_14_0_8_um_filter_43_12]